MYILIYIIYKLVPNKEKLKTFKMIYYFIARKNIINFLKRNIKIKVLKVALTYFE